MQIPDSIRKQREHLNLSQQNLADDLDITQQAFQLIETGKTLLKIDMAEKIAQILQIPVTQIYFVPNAPEPTSDVRNLYEMYIQEKDKLLLEKERLIQEKEKNIALHQTIIKLIAPKNSTVAKTIASPRKPKSKQKPKSKNKT